MLCNFETKQMSSNNREESPRARYPELAAVLVLGAAHVVIEVTLDLRFSRVFNAAALTICLVYLGWRLSTSQDVLHVWGIRADNFWSALRAQLLFVGPATAVLLVVGLLRGNAPVPPTFWLVCGLYPLFGVAQQFVLQNLIVFNLRDLLRHDGLCAFVAALLFSLSHLPRTSLSAFAFVGSFFFTLIHQRRPNIWAVGIMHGLLAALVFYMILGEDPGAKVLHLLNQISRME